MRMFRLSRVRLLGPAVAGLAAAAMVAGAAQAASGSVHAAARADSVDASSAHVLVSTRQIRGLGRVLVDNKGLTLYMFVPDKGKRVTCVSTCAAVWPPVFLPKGHSSAVAGRGVEAKLLGSDRDPAGGRVVTYHHWPLYTYVGDKKPGMATGQALDLNGGLWYVLARSGKVIHTKLR